MAEEGISAPDEPCGGKESEGAATKVGRVDSPSESAAAVAAAAKPPIYPTKPGRRPTKSGHAGGPFSVPSTPTNTTAVLLPGSSTPLNPDDWSADMDIALFAAIAKYKPVGAHRHFRMISVQRHFNCQSPRQLSTSEIWARLSQLYNLELIEAANAYNEDDDESDLDATDRVDTEAGRGRLVKNPLERKAEFQLPREEFQALMERRTDASESDTSHSAQTAEDDTTRTRSLSASQASPDEGVKRTRRTSAQTAPRARGRGRGRAGTQGRGA